MSEQENNPKEFIGSLLNSFRSEIEKDREDNQEEIIYGEEYITKLQDAYNNFFKKNLFQTGQLVKWKKNLKNRKFPHENQPAVVIEILHEPIIDSREETGTPYFRESLDIILGILVDDTFLTFYL